MSHPTPDERGYDDTSFARAARYEPHPRPTLPLAPEEQWPQAKQDFAIPHRPRDVIRNGKGIALDPDDDDHPDFHHLNGE